MAAKNPTISKAAQDRARKTLARFNQDLEEQGAEVSLLRTLGENHAAARDVYMGTLLRQEGYLAALHDIFSDADLKRILDEDNEDEDE